MPFRCLAYLTDLLNKLTENKRVLYRKLLIRFPSPKFFVLYDGKDKESLFKPLRLSDSFDDNDFSLELIVFVININHSMDQCRYLNDYSFLVGLVKSGIAT